MTRDITEETYAKGSRGWPQLTVDFAVFQRYLSERADALAHVLPNDARAADLFIACACVHNAPGAVAAFIKEYGRCIADAGRRVDPSRSFADELTQQLSDILFVGTNGAVPKIAGYTGKGALSGWVAVTAKRMALHLRNRGNKLAERAVQGDLIELAVLSAGPDIEYLKSRYAAELNDALMTAFQSLEARLKVVLRLTFVNGLTEKSIGAMYNVHQATISRWKAEAEEHVLDHVKRILCEQHQLAETEAVSLIRALRSELDFNISRVFASEQTSASDASGR